MNFDDPRIPVNATAPRAGGPKNDTAMSLQDQARRIIQAVLTDPGAEFPPGVCASGRWHR
ncbi:UNVERIFIED_ORG: hypothetical protein ABIB19_003302 [Arthrobacter sp. UYEF10]